MRAGLSSGFAVGFPKVRPLIDSGRRYAPF